MTYATTAGPFVPASALARLLAPVIERDGIDVVAARIGCSPRQVFRWISGEAARATFSIADRVITDVLDEPGLWRTEPELAAVYAELGR